MGRQGIRRRKAVQHLPKVSVRNLPIEDDTIPPNIMWPAKGSGFEADPSSPAGSAQREWWLIQRVGNTGIGRWAIRLTLVSIACGLVIGLVNIFRH